MPDKKVCIVGASGKLGRYMVQHALDRGYEVVGVCRVKSVGKLDAFEGRITVIPGPTNDREIIKQAIADCDGVLTVLVPWGVHGYSSGTARAVLDHADPGARLVFSCGWHITRDGQDVYSRAFRWTVGVFGWLARLLRLVDLNDQVEACRLVFASDTSWTVVRGSDLEEGESQGLPVWSRHVGDPILESNITRRVDFALFMVDALRNNELIHEAPAIVGCQTSSALAAAAARQEDGPQRHERMVDADYHQFYVWDAGAGRQAPEDYSDEDVRRMVKVAPSVVVVQPVRSTEVPVELEVNERDPGFRPDDWDHVVEAGLDLPTGKLEVHECTGGPVLNLDVPPGSFRVRVLFSGLGTLSADGLEGQDRYRVNLWPGEAGPLRVVKQWAGSGTS